jgi:hypothetical protein
VGVLFNRFRVRSMCEISLANNIYIHKKRSIRVNGNTSDRRFKCALCCVGRRRRCPDVHALSYTMKLWISMKNPYQHNVRSMSMTFMQPMRRAAYSPIPFDPISSCPSPAWCSAANPYSNAVAQGGGKEELSVCLRLPT